MPSTPASGARADDDARGRHACSKLRSQPVAAPVKADKGLDAADGGQARARHARHGALLADEAARQRRDHQRIRVGIGLRVARVDPGQAAGQLDDRVLKSAARPEQRQPLLARTTDGGVDGVVVAIGRPGNHPHAVDGVQPRFDVAVGWHPRAVRPARKQRQRSVELAVRDVGEIAIAEQGDADVAHCAPGRGNWVPTKRSHMPSVMSARWPMSTRALGVTR